MQGDDFPPTALKKEGLILQFYDDFTGTSLDTDKWLPYYLPQWSQKERSEARYSLHNGHPHLHIEADQEPWSFEYNGDLRVSSLQTGCFCGDVGSSVGQHPFRSDLKVCQAWPTMRRYTPRHGYFEVRLKAVPLPGYMCAFWMIGFEDLPEHSAEICICEIKGETIRKDSSVIGYGVHPFNDPNITDAFYEEEVPIDASTFHVYAADWTRDEVSFFIDGTKVRSIQQSPTYAMQFMLNIYELPDTLTGDARNASFPKTMVVDYVRGYQHTG